MSGARFVKRKKKKSELIPSQKFGFFWGARYDLIQFLIYPTVENWDKVQKSVHLILDNSHLTAGSSIPVDNRSVNVSFESGRLRLVCM